MKFVRTEATGKQAMVPLEEYAMLMNALKDLSTLLRNLNRGDIPSDVAKSLGGVFTAALEVVNTAHEYNLRDN